MRIIVFLLAASLLLSAAQAQVVTGEVKKTFNASHPSASVEAVANRFRYREALPDNYDIKAETFDVFVPDNYDGTKSFGLIVAFDRNGQPDQELKDVLTERKLLWVSPPADNRHELHVYGLAIDATVNMAGSYKVDKKRIILLGTGSEARWAGRMGVVGGDVFDKVILAGNLDYFRDLKIPGSRTTGINRAYYPASYDQPRGGTFNQARKSSRFVFLAPDDLTEENHQWCVLHQGFEQDFRNVTILQRPKREAYRFDGQTLGAALDAVDK